MLTELRNRGIRDVLIVCCDGLTGLPEVIGQIWPAASVQTCVVHLIRNSMRYASWKDRKVIAAALRPIYAAATAEAAEQALDEFAGSEVGRRCPAVVDVWRRAWNEFVPVPGPARRDPPRRLHHQRDREHQLPAAKVSKTRGQFPNDDAVYKILYLAVCDIETRDKSRGGDAEEEKHPVPRLNHPRLDRRTQPVRDHLPRATTRPNLTNPEPVYTANLTRSGGPGQETQPRPGRLGQHRDPRQKQRR